MDLGGRQWHIHLTPGTLELYAAAIIAVIVTIAISFALIARRRARQAETAIKALQEEVRERLRAEKAVGELNTELARRRADERVQSLQKEYLLTLAEKNRELELRNEEVERANRLKTEFLTGMSHELRTPLHTIIGFSELLAEELEGSLNPKQRRFVEYVHRDALHLLELINALLDLSKVEAGKVELKLQEFALRTAVDEVLSSIHVRAATKSIAIESGLEGEFSIRADRVHFKQILLNLVGNAVKFTPEGGRVWISSSCTDGFLEISVRDTGVGIPKEAQLSIFDKFFQLENSVRGRNDGTGLGLAITKALVEQHGGRIWVESEPGQGSCFRLTIPRQ